MNTQNPISNEIARLDPSFNNNGIVTLESPEHEIGVAQGIATTKEGNIYVAGSFGRRYFLARLLDNGHLDGNFGNNGLIQDSYAEGVSSATGILVLSDGTLLLSGFHSGSVSARPAFALYGTQGNLITSFGDNGKVVVSLPEQDGPTVDLPMHRKTGASGSPRNSIVLPYGKILSVFGRYIFQLTKDGRLDEGFNGRGHIIFEHPEHLLSAMAILKPTADTILVSGHASSADAGVFAQYQADGTLDRSFGNHGFTLLTNLDCPTSIGSLALTNDRKILGFGMTQSPPYKGLIVRLDADGKVDDTFNDGEPRLTPSDESREFGWYDGAVDTQGRIIATGGSLEPQSGEGYIATARFSPEGKVDEIFAPRSGWVREEGVRADAVAIDDKGRIVLAGNFGYFSSTRPIVLRYLS